MECDIDPIDAINLLLSKKITMTEIATRAGCARVTLYRTLEGTSRPRGLLRNSLNSLVAKTIEREKRSNAARKGHRRRKDRRRVRVAHYTHG